MKKFLAIILSAMILATAMAGCGNDNNTATPDTAATSDEAVKATNPTNAAAKPTTPVDKAIAEQGLTVNDKGEIVDKDGNKVETTADGKVKVKTADGSTVEVNADEVRTSNQNVAEYNNSANNNGGSNNNGSGNAGGSGNNNSGNGNAGGGSGNAGGGSPAPSPQPDEKTWHEAEYKTVHHDAVTEQRYVVDEEAYTYEEPVYEERWVTICNDCGADITDDPVHHAAKEAINGGKGSYRNEPRKVQVGTKTVEVPEKGHYETVVVQEAYDEQVLVREAGWY
ncbi:MAG: hypothetical protein ACI4G1_07565 [Ruminococcus sp.]